MKSITTYINEKLIVNKNTRFKYNYFPQTKEELKDIIEKLVDEQSMEDIINLNFIDTSKITDMSDLFDSMEGLLKIDISYWDVSNVKRMDYMFRGCVNLEKIIGIEDFDVSQVENMEGVFAACESFNQPLNNWDVTNVTNMENMFCGCYEFNQPLDKWNVSNIENMNSMFHGCYKFNQDISDWNVSKVTDMRSMFYCCYEFNQPLNNWDVSNVRYKLNIFLECPIEEKYKPKKFR